MYVCVCVVCQSNEPFHIVYIVSIYLLYILLYGIWNAEQGTGTGIACFQRLHLNRSILCQLLYMNMYVVISFIIIVLPGMQIYVCR